MGKMENQTGERSQTSIAERAKRVRDRLWRLVEAQAGKIPVEAETVRAVGRIADQLTAPKFENAASFFRQKAGLLGKIEAVGSAAFDLTLAAVFGGKSLRVLRAYGTPAERRNRVENLARLREEAPIFGGLTTDAVKQYEKKLLPRALTYGGLSAGIILFRPVSRLAFYGARAGGALGERVARVVNTIALRQETGEKPGRRFALVGSGKAGRA